MERDELIKWLDENITNATLEQVENKIRELTLLTKQKTSHIEIQRASIENQNAKI